MSDRLTITLPSGTRGTVHADRFRFRIGGLLVDVWAANQYHARAVARVFAHTIVASSPRVVQIDDRPADETISGGVVWDFGTPNVPAIRHRMGYNVDVES